MTPNLEQLAGRAVIDQTFRRLLLDDPAGAVALSGLQLSAEELGQVGRAVEGLRANEDMGQEFEVQQLSTWQ